MARDVRQLRLEASEATASGKYKRALSAYLELEQLEPRDAQWSKRAAETYRRIGKDKDAVGAYTRAADRYAQSGFLVQAMAVCKLILQIEPKNDDALRRIASMNEQIGASPTRAVAMAESNPNIAEHAAVVALRSGATGAIPVLRDVEPPPQIAIPRTRTPESVSVARKMTPQELSNLSSNMAATRAASAAFEEERRRPHSTPPPFSIPRTKSKPISVPPDLPLETISFRDEVADSFEREEKSGVYVIPIDGEDDELPVEVDVEAEGSGGDSAPVIEIEPPSDDFELDASAIDESTELEMGDIEEIPLPEPRLVGAAAAEALAATPLFAGLSQEALGSLVQQLTLVHLSTDEVLFHEGDPGDALYVIVEGEVAVLAEGPPRVEMARLGAGAFIGEVALMIDQPRSATVMATQDAELLRIDRKTLSHVLATHGEVLAAVLRFVRDRLVDRWTRTSPLFRPFEPSERAAIASRFKFLEIDSGSTLLTAGSKPDGLYIVLAGKFTVKRGDALLATLGPGELIGEAALLNGAIFKSTVVARGKSLALCLPAKDFRNLIMTHPHVLEYIGEAAEQSEKLEIL